MKWIPQSFNDLLAIVVVVIVVAYVLIATALNWDNKVIDLAMGVFLAKFSDVVQFYFRKAKDDLPFRRYDHREIGFYTELARRRNEADPPPPSYCRRKPEK